jgi:hypothetical protein
LACLKAHPEVVDNSNMFVPQCCSRPRFSDKTFPGVGSTLSDIRFNYL